MSKRARNSVEINKKPKLKIDAYKFINHVNNISNDGSISPLSHVSHNSNDSVLSRLSVINSPKQILNDNEYNTAINSPTNLASNNSNNNNDINNYFSDNIVENNFKNKKIIKKKPKARGSIELLPKPVYPNKNKNKNNNNNNNISKKQLNIHKKIIKPKNNNPYKYSPSIMNPNKRVSLKHIVGFPMTNIEIETEKIIVCSKKFTNKPFGFSVAPDEFGMNAIVTKVTTEEALEAGIKIGFCVAKVQNRIVLDYNHAEILNYVTKAKLPSIISFADVKSNIYI